ncbi:hypothetical protein [Haloplanus halobius]|uniref:hypothetical protein n=1 Tax=Haloplanus halobius TaxID=2934938 RepID=UPI00200D5FB1|nr:hypothetical protein [Haloplanus sp. XH21]
MDRRAFLTVVGAGLSGMAGCGEGGDGAATPTDTDGTETPTSTATPTTTTATRTPPERQYQPQLLDAALVSMWSEPGDLQANQVESVRRGQPAVVAFRYRLRVPEGTINLKEGVDILHDGDLITRQFRDMDRQVDEAGLYTWEDAMTFETAEWPVGDLTATVAIGELQLHRTSAEVSTQFTVRE